MERQRYTWDKALVYDRLMNKMERMEEIQREESFCFG
jgi:hypothetical protein